MDRNSYSVRLFFLLKRICNATGKKSKFFKTLEKRLIEIEKTIRLLLYTTEWLSKKEFKFNVVNDIYYPTIKTIRKLHDYLILKYEEDIDKIHKGEFSLGALKFVGIKYYMKPKFDKKEDIIFRGANIFNRFLEEGHPFVDGNKRTGMATLWLFLVANGYHFIFPEYFRESEQVKKIECWADGKRSSDNISEIVKWIKKYVKEK